MIHVVTGKVGAGKSLWVMSQSIQHLVNGGVVASNMTIHLDAVRRIYHRRIAPWQLVHIEATSDPREIPVGDLRGHGRRKVMVVLDECLNWFQSEGKSVSADERKRLWSEWLRQSDKLGQQVFFVAQNFERAAKWIRELAQVAVNICNFGQIRLFGMPVGKWCHMEHLGLAVAWDVASKQRLWTSFVTLTPRVWDCYETAELYGFDAASSAYLATTWPAYHLPGVRLLWLPCGWLVVRGIVEVFR